MKGSACHLIVFATQWSNAIVCQVQLLLIQKVAFYSIAAGILDDLWLQVSA